MSCTNLTTFPAISAPEATTFSGAWAGCDNLTGIYINAPSATNFNNTWSGCRKLSAVDFGTNTFSKMTSGTDCFLNCTLPAQTWSAILTSCSATNFNTNVRFHGGNSKYFVRASQARNTLVNNRSWDITDGGPSLGSIWNQVESARHWTGVAVSDNGQYMSAVVDISSLIYYSLNSGQTWSTFALGSNKNFYDVAMSSTGQYQLAVGWNSTHYGSSNYGQNWTNRNIAGYYYGAAISSSGQYQTVLRNSARILISNDYGATFTESNLTIATNWRKVAMSSDGAIQVATNQFNGVYYSSNYGVDWTLIKSGNAWAVGMSSNGQYITISNADTNGPGYLYVSSNYGATWTQVDASRYWETISIDSTGQFQVASTRTEGVYISDNFGSNWSKTGLSNTAWTDNIYVDHISTVKIAKSLASIIAAGRDGQINISTE